MVIIPLIKLKTTSGVVNQVLAQWSLPFHLDKLHQLQTGL